MLGRAGLHSSVVLCTDNHSLVAVGFVRLAFFSFFV